MFESVPSGPSDPIFELKFRADSDPSPLKVDLGVGIYRNESGEYYELQTIKKVQSDHSTLIMTTLLHVKQAKWLLDQRRLGHDYCLTTGKEEFLSEAARILFGPTSECLKLYRVASVQCVGGTGANHLGAEFLKMFCQTSPAPRIYLGTPTWGNYEPLFSHAGVAITRYRHYDGLRRKVDFQNIVETVRSAPEGSIFILQACCHNPTGADLSRGQWRQMAGEMKRRRQLPFFDIAYQGFGDGLEEDAGAVRMFVDLQFEMIVCQSFSKNMGLYGERVGALHVVTGCKASAANVKDQLRCLIRWEHSSSLSYGARLVYLILSDSRLNDEWRREVSSMMQRLLRMRRTLHDLLIGAKNSGNWSQILNEKGLFSYLPLTARQCEILSSEFHIHLPSSGRINVAGLNDDCIQRVASAIDQVVRREQRNNLGKERRPKIVEEGDKIREHRDELAERARRP